jgi:hypothetical protein
MAYEASGDKKSALTNFMEVYGPNIDFRNMVQPHQGVAVVESPNNIKD